jgi:hypothetical protein
MTQPRWVSTCGCGRETSIRDLEYVTTGGAGECDAEHPPDYIGAGEPPTVVGNLGWCGCGSPEDIDALMLAYLRSRTGEDWPKPAPVGVSPDAAVLLAYMADALDWSEHGISIGGAWLTERGERALATLEQRHLE